MEDDDFPIESRFVLDARVGRGGSGDVHRALDRRTGDVVAVKRLLSQDDEHAVARFRREARLLAQVGDPHVVRYLAHGVDDRGRPCLVVEWLEGEDLAHRQKRSRLTFVESLGVARQIATGLAALHDVGIIHRDVKPANVYLLDDGAGGLRAKLIDLGIARASSESTLTTVGLAIGTPSYMSPEQVRGEERVTTRSDQFSLGVVLFELVTGRRPFTGDDQFAILAKIVLGEPPRLRDLVPGVPLDLDTLVHRALAKDPLDRFGSTHELVAAIAAVPPWNGPLSLPEDPSDDTPTARAGAALSSTFEQRVITALFAGFAEASVDRDRHAVAAIAEALGGVCHGTLGHRMIAVFGGARSTGDEAVRAARAALLAAERVPGLQLAIATGRALTGVTGLSGDLLERGAREIDRHGAPAIHLDEPTARLLAEHFVIEDRVLSGVRPAAAAPRTLVGKPTPLVGRDRELASLEAAFTECISEPVARAVVVSGPAGIGKSRLRHELSGHIARADPRPEILIARGSPIAVDSAFGLLAPLVRRFAGILDGEPAADQWRKLSARVAPRVSARTTLLLGEIASLPDVSSSEPGPRRDAMHRGDLLRAAWIEWLEAECSVRPIVIVLEDLHWGDRASVSFVGAALRALAELPLFVVGLGRPELHERFPGSWLDDSALAIRLGPLTPKASERLVRAVLGSTATDIDVQRIVGRADGNPFYLEELVRAVAEGASDALPDTVLGMVQARLDALGAGTKRVLRAGSVFGQTFWQSGVVALLGDPIDTVTEALDRLVAAEIVARRDAGSFPGENDLVFRHALVRDAAYAMIPDDDRRVAHRLAGAFLERAGAADPAILAAHFERGDESARAAVHHLVAAEKALAGHDFAAAVTHGDRAIAAGCLGEDRGRARLIQAEAYRWRGEMALGAPAAAEAAELLPRGAPIWFHAAREAIAANGRLGRFELVVSWATEALRVYDAARLADASADIKGPLLAALAPAAGQMIYSGNTEQTARILLEIERISASAGKLDPAVAARLHQVRALLADHERDLESALAYNEAAIDGFERAGDRRAACLTLANTGFIHASLGNFVEAEDALRRAHATASRMGLGTIAPLALHNLGGVLHQLGRLEEAQHAEEAAVRAFAAAGDPRLEGASRVYLSRILLAAGDARGAEAEARRVAENAASPAPLRAGALAARSRALRAQGLLADAVATAAEAAQALAALGAVEDFETLIGVAHAEALHSIGDHEGAKAAVGDACRRIFARAVLLRETARARFLEAVPDNVHCLELARAFGVALETTS
ncbi:Adenylate cyclase [Minicystis rosea]|nr:Adenylate cyclase [Minicystis rosea]